MYFKTLITILAGFAVCLPLSAQFYQMGDDPASAKWSWIESPHFRIIYPEGLDSTARDYAVELEKYRLPVSHSAGFIPGEKISARMPVVLHPYSAMSNGSVAWAPKRMDLLTSPPAYNPEPLPWKTMLGIHELRHVAQMQFGLSYCFRPFRYVFGEMFAGAVSGVYPNQWLLEGDAVVAETALSHSGRGRVSDFMNYYRIAFDNGDFRNPTRWKYGSYWRYTPDHYAYGYMVLSGIRYMYDVPDFTGQLLTHYARRPYDIFAKNTVSRKLTGKRFKLLVKESIALYHDIWTEDMQNRGPFLPYTKISGKPHVFTEYSDNLVIGDTLYTLKESFNKGRRLVRIDSSGKEKTISAFGSDVGMLYWSPALNRLFWSETLPDMRWSLKYDSAIRYLDFGTGKKGTLARDGRMFNPNPSPADGHIAVTEYTDDGKSRLSILTGLTGAREISFAVPDSLQLVETAWHNDTVYATAISDRGYGIYHLEISHLNRHDGDSDLHHHEETVYHHDDMEYVWKETLAPSPVMIFNFGMDGPWLMFTSDRTGTNEMYRMDPHSGRIFQETSLKYGGVDFTFSEDGRDLICSAADITGAPLVRIDADSLLHREVDFHERYTWKIADSLSGQEKRLAAENGVAEVNPETVAVSSPEKYRKFPHLFNLHSWAPAYFDFDNISDSSYEEYYSYLSLGASAIFQNRLGTFTGFAGYSAHEDPVFGDRWRHSGHVKLTYSGLYPVLEAQVDFNDRASRTLAGAVYSDMTGIPFMEKYGYEYNNGPLVSGKFSMYIPFNFSSGGWSRGLIPRISYSVSNDRINSWKYMIRAVPDPIAGTVDEQITGITQGRSAIYQSLTATLRYYTMLPAAHADVYPELGIGIEAGGSVHPGMKNMVTPSVYLHTYGYLPGIYGNQGLMLSATFNKRIGGQALMASGVNTLPRGLSHEEDLSSWASMQSCGLKLSADYAMPFPLGDFSILNLFYVSRGIITPHFDWSFIGKEQFYSVGATLEVEFGSFFGMSFPASVGVTYSYNGGPSFGSFQGLGRHYAGPVFSVDF